ncbi:MAG: hypothetical protein QOD94_714 [Alphaproteobacteria bacterium]|nr:hypothetical protein [Alphaproteobacteria bacterium]
MAKPDLGTKRLCGNCAAKFYDLSKTPIVCPKCETVFVVAPVSSRARPDAAAAARAAAAAAVVVPEVVAPETAEAEFVSLEEADAETTGAKTEVEGEDVEIDPALDADAFIEEQEEGDADVTDIIGDVDKEEET